MCMNESMNEGMECLCARRVKQARSDGRKEKRTGVAFAFLGPEGRFCTKWPHLHQLFFDFYKRGGHYKAVKNALKLDSNC